jgi:osmotically inducible protein OsmC
MESLYTAEATAWGGREGRAATSDGRVDVQLSLPKGMGGDDGPGTNPEQLFATGWSACFHSALKLVARGRKIDVSESAVTVKVDIGFIDEKRFGIGAAIEAELPGVDPVVARELLEAAHEVCPYSNATRGNVEVSLDLVE